MSRVSAEQVRQFILSYLSTKLYSSGRTLPSDLKDDYDLVREGVIDSLGMLRLTVELEAHFGEIDFAELDPEEMTIVGPLCRYVAEALK